MSEPYTPTIEEIVSHWVIASPNRGMSVPEREEAARRALAARAAEVRVRALWDAYGAVADLRPPGFSVIFYTHAREKDGILWEAQKTVGAMAREAEKGGAS